MDTISEINFEKSCFLLLSVLMFCTRHVSGIQVWGFIEIRDKRDFSIGKEHYPEGGKPRLLRGVICAIRIYIFSG
jgi:hypothetical protein